MTSRIFLLIVLLVPSWAHAQYAFSDLDVDLPGLRGGRATALFGCTATGINDEGVIVGACSDQDRNSESRGFVYDGRRFEEVYFPTAKGAYPSLPPARYENTPFLRQGVGLGLLNRVQGVVPQDLNSAGEIAGWFFQFRLQGFVKQHGRVSGINVPDAQLTEATGINDAGDVVGDWFRADSVAHGFLLSNGVYTVFGNDLGAFDINNLGQIVGCYALCSRGFLREPDGTITSIDVPGATVTQVRGINDAGQMVVLAAYFDGAMNSFT